MNRINQQMQRNSLFSIKEFKFPPKKRKNLTYLTQPNDSKGWQ